MSTRHIDAGALRSVARYLMEHGDDCCPGIGAGVVVQTRKLKVASTNPIYKFVLTNGTLTASVIAKWAPLYAWNNEGLTEFNHYGAFNSKYAAQSHFRCPRPIGFLETENVLLSEEAKGTSFSALLRNTRTVIQDRDIVRAVENCAAWLAAFHSLLPCTLVCFSSPEEMIQDFVPYLAYEWFAGWGDDWGLDLIGRKSNEALRSLKMQWRLGLTHRDFGPGNILVSSGNVTVLDAACNQIGPQALDIADFVAYLRILPFISTRSCGFCKRLELAFRETYMQASNHNKDFEVTVRVLLVNSLLRNLERHIKQAQRLPGVLQRAAMRYLHRRYKQSLIHAINDL